MAHGCEIWGRLGGGPPDQHAHNVSNRRFRPNLKSVRTATPGGPSG